MATTYRGQAITDARDLPARAIVGVATSNRVPLSRGPGGRITTRKEQDRAPPATDRENSGNYLAAPPGSYYVTDVVPTLARKETMMDSTHGGQGTGRVVTRT